MQLSPTWTHGGSGGGNEGGGGEGGGSSGGGGDGGLKQPSPKHTYASAPTVSRVSVAQTRTAAVVKALSSMVT